MKGNGMQRSRIGNTALLAGLWLALGGVAHAQTYTQTETITYHDNTTKWVLGQVAQRSVNGTVTSSATFDATTAQQLTYSVFNRLQKILNLQC